MTVISTWGIVAICFTLMVLGFFYVCFLGIVAWLKSMEYNSRYIGVWHTDNGRLKDIRPLVDVGGLMDESMWKLHSTNPRKVKFKVKPKGIGRSEEMEWDRSDVVELPREDGTGFVIYFNLKGLKQSWVFEKELILDQMDRITAKSALYRHKWLEADTRVKEEAEKFAKFSKDLIPFGGFTKPSGAKK